jgi:hypothetical protein
MLRRTLAFPMAGARVAARGGALSGPRTLEDRVLPSLVIGGLLLLVVVQLGLAS